MRHKYYLETYWLNRMVEVELVQIDSVRGIALIDVPGKVFGFFGKDIVTRKWVRSNRLVQTQRRD